MRKRRIIIILAVMILIGISACSAQEPETNSIESNLKQIYKGLEWFSELKNGTLEVYGTFQSDKNAVASLNLSGTDKVYFLTTFVSNRKGYDYIQETVSLNKKTGETNYSAVKQVNGSFYNSVPLELSTGERTESYEWGEAYGQQSGTGYEPNGTLKIMEKPDKLLSNREYIDSIIREPDGLLVKYIVTASDAYATYIKEEAHSIEESYILHEHREVYWINEDGLLIKNRTYDDFEWTIDGIADHYISDMTTELTGYNYKKLKNIGDELPPMIMFDGELYQQSDALLDVNADVLKKVGTINSVVGSVQKPEQNNQANRLIKNAVVYRGGEASIIVKYKDYRLYEKCQ